MRKVYVICLVLALFCTIAEAAKKFPMTASSVVPAARGQVEIDKDKNGNTRVNMKVEHLSNPQNLTPSAAVYVVWLQDRGGNPENQGQLKVDKKLKANFESVTPSKTFDLLVTAEQDSSAKSPGGPEVGRRSSRESETADNWTNRGCIGPTFVKEGSGQRDQLLSAAGAALQHKG
jgi:hypothetical protein